MKRPGHSGYVTSLLSAAFAGSINKRVAAYIIVFSSAITFIGTAVQLGYDYLTELDIIEIKLQQTHRTHALGIAQSLWNFDTDQVAATLAGILKTQDIIYVAVRERETNLLIEAGEKADAQFKEESFEIVYADNGETVGALTVQASLAGVNERMLKRFLTILTVQGIKTFIVACFMLYVFYVVIIRHLQFLANYARSVELGSDSTDIFLDRRESNFTRHDELSQLVDALNYMRRNISDSYKTILKNEKELELHRDHLEEMVKQRTQEIETLQARLIDSAHKSGMAEIATDVLHKVGNILNTVGIKLYNARTNSKMIPIDKLKKIAPVLRQDTVAVGSENEGEVDRKKLANYLEKVVDKTVATVDMVDADLVALNAELERLQSVVSEQVKYIDAPEYVQMISLKMLIEEEANTFFKRNKLSHTVAIKTDRIIATQKHGLQRVLRRLLECACHSIKSRPKETSWIDVAVWDEIDAIVLQVSDNGHGFEKKDVEKLFDMKSKAYSESTDNPLHEAAVLAHKLKFTLTANSEGLGMGEVFELRIPYNGKISDEG